MLIEGEVFTQGQWALQAQKLSLEACRSARHALDQIRSDFISSSHIRLIRCLAVIGQASCRIEHLVYTCMNKFGNTN